MDYTLAKELKVARFPYSKRVERGELTCQHLGKKQEDHVFTIDCDLQFIPTLSELIRALSNIQEKNDVLHPFELSYIVDHENGNEWFSGYGVAVNYPFGEVGKTPEEAVARLWLALNKHERK